MRASLSPEVVTAWQVFSWMMGIYVGYTPPFPPLDPGYLNIRAATQKGFNLQLGAAQSVGKILGAAKRDHIFYFFTPSSLYFGRLKTKLRSYDAYYVPSHGALLSGGPIIAFSDMTYGLSVFEQEIAREVLNSHVTGYSTSTHDLLHDLIP